MDTGTDRVVALVDMDCFYVQVEQRINPELKAKPCVVAQYKTWKGGGIIAVSYEARAFGVTKNMWADDAKKLCPDLQVARVRESHGKADLTCYREASSEVLEVMSRFAVIERASIDEAYMDLTASVKQRLDILVDKPIAIEGLMSTFVEGYPQASEEEEEEEEEEKVEDATAPKDALRIQGLSQWMDSLPPTSQRTNADLQLAVGAVIIEEMRAAVEKDTGFRCSAGISHNKVLAKLACGLNKPNRQTILPLSSVPQLFNGLPISKIRHLGGKLGISISETLNVDNIGELSKFPQDLLVEKFGMKTGPWLYNLCRGIEFEPVKPRQLPKSIGCSKNFPGKTSLDTKEKVQYWLQQLSLELEERLTKDRDDNGRIAKLLTVAVKQAGETKTGGFSRCCTLARYDAERISTDSLALIKSLNCAGNHQQAWSPPFTLLHLSASKFMDAATSLSGGITGFLKSEIAPTQQKPFLSSQVPNGSTTQQPGKRPGEIMSFFQNASKRTRQCHAEPPEGAASTELNNQHEKGEDKKPGEIMSFFQSASKRIRQGHAEPPEDTATELNDQHEKGEDKKTGEIMSFFQNASKRIRQGHAERPEDTATELNDQHEKGEDKNEDGEDDRIDSYSTIAEQVVQMVLPLKTQDCSPATIQTDGSTHTIIPDDPCSSATIQADATIHTNTHVGPCVSSERSPAFTFAPEDYIRCDSCGQEVLAWEMPEHTDYHFAQDLQTSWSSSLPSSSQVPANISKANTSDGNSQCKTVQASRRKSATSRTPAKMKKPAGKGVSIDHFFKKS